MINPGDVYYGRTVAEAQARAQYAYMQEQMRQQQANMLYGLSQVQYPPSQPSQQLKPIEALDMVEVNGVWMTREDAGRR